MTIDELKREADKNGYRMYRKPDYQCSCYLPYPNERHKMKNGRWKCVDRYEPVEHKWRYKPTINYPITFCKRKDKVTKGGDTE